jgi:uncharacterized protein (TIGR02271 family)
MANDYLRDRSVEQSSTSTNRVVAFFEDKDDAYDAIRDLRSAGFTSDQIGLATADDQFNHEYDSTGSPVADVNTSSNLVHDDKSMWQEIKDFFTGSDHDVNRDDYTDFHTSTSGMNWDNDRSGYYQSGIERGGAVVTVIGSRIDEARGILEKHDADLRESGFDRSSFAGVDLADRYMTGARASDRNIAPSSREEAIDRDQIADRDREQRIQLRGEMLRTYKERVQRGEVRLRKEVVSENQSIDVPVEREELVIERVPGSQASATGEIGDDQEIRVPLSEERVRVDKKPVVNEEVRVGKRQVQNTQQVSDTVRHEELRVDKDGDVDVNDAATNPKRKKPAA